MAAEFLRGHGVDLQQEIDKAQESSTVSQKHESERRHKFRANKIRDVRLSGHAPVARWDVHLEDGKRESVKPAEVLDYPSLGPSLEKEDQQILDGGSRLLLPSLCHPHIHLDKCFLLSHPKYGDLEIVTGDFAEALELTSKAKERFEVDDLVERGEWLIQESIAAGVTHMRAFVEVDNTVRFMCLDTGLKLKERFRDRCEIQICAFAQDPVFSLGKNNPGGKALIEEALSREGVDVLGTTPYVEANEELMRTNVNWAIKTTVAHKKHLDLHLDYNLEASKLPLIHHVLNRLHEAWTANDQSKTIVLGHCTRLTLFTPDEWGQLKMRIADLPIYFVGLPTSDLFMMGKPVEEANGGQRVRGTLQIPQMVQKYGFKGVVGVNNVGNAFTPQGNCDPLSVASMGVGVYQAGTKADTQILYDCVSSGAKAAIGYPQSESPYEKGAPADFVLFNNCQSGKKDTTSSRHRRSVQEIVYDPPPDRQTVRGGWIH